MMQERTGYRIPVLLNLHIMLNNTGLTPFEKYEWSYTSPHFQPFKRADEEAGETLEEKNTWELPLTKNIHTVILIELQTEVLLKPLKVW